MDFVAIDFETANTNGDPCALGLAIVRDKSIVSSDSYLINPHAPFSQKCVDIHGINPSDVLGAPNFGAVWNEIYQLFDKYPIVAHNAGFDIWVLRNALKKCGANPPDTKYYCTLKLSKKLCTEQPKHTLDYLCDAYGICLNNHHDCQQDAIACANFMIFLEKEFSDSIFPCGSLGDQANFRVSHELSAKPAYLQGNAAFDQIDDPIVFSGKNFVITGEFLSFTRRQLTEYITARGGTVKSAVSKKTNYLLVGLENLSSVVNSSECKSSKILQAEKIEASGIDIIILNEKQFLELEGLTI